MRSSSSTSPTTAKPKSADRILVSVAEIAENVPRVRLYGTTYCGSCRRAEALLVKEGIPFEKIDVTGDDETRMALVEAAGGRRTVPVIFVDGRVIGGYEDLMRLVAAHGI
jgi:glutaredoxin 3